MIFFTDLDGTLLDDRKEIPAPNRRAIDKLLQAGHRIVLASGRALPSVLHQAHRLGLAFDGCYVIAFNGGELYDVFNRKTLYKNRIPMEAVIRIFALCDSRGVHIQTYDDNDVIALHDTPHLRRYCREIICQAKLVDDISTALDQEPSKLLLLDYDNHDILVEMQGLILREAGDILDAFFSGSGLLEVVPKGTDKGVAVHQLCQVLDIPLEDTVAAGDGMNDIPMLRAAHVGAAVANAAPETKAQADYVTSLDNNHGGVAEIIEKFILHAESM